jgi:hypothetical protein
MLKLKPLPGRPPIRSKSTTKKPNTRKSISQSSFHPKNYPLITDCGLLKSTNSHPLLSDPNSLTSTYTKICMADFLGEHNTSFIEHKKILFPVRMQVKRKVFCEEIHEKRNLRRPTTPHMMDQHLKLRMIIEKRNNSHESFKSGGFE